eukprot:TRINITY_DN3001_c0_g1_i1.p1 TRINITY_DN3001_c0_g1~~TRINITY_DN3001_c0_g1_i1.p1  ORF type:complete len:372 (+),score=41.23 TRINITY_DN3001_c0_g1_i1:67-1182(+)
MQQPTRSNVVRNVAQEANSSAVGSTYDYEFLQSLDGIKAKSVGTLLGCMCGDTIGSRVEGVGYHIPFSKIFEEGKFPIRGYTDDTEMTYGLAKSLVRKGYCDREDTTKAYVEEFTPNRGYSKGTQHLLTLLKYGDLTYETSGRWQFKDGSYANGGAMRISPVAIAYRNAPPEKLLEAVINALYCTHVHPFGIDGAYLQALVVQQLCRQEIGSLFKLVEFLRNSVKTKEMQQKIDTILRSLKELHRTKSLKVPMGYVWEGDANDTQWQFDIQVLQQITESFQIRATDAAATALYAFCRHYNDPLGAVKGVISHGGDADTIGAMVGAMGGALHGCRWIPKEWWNALQTPMRDQMIEIALSLAELDVDPSTENE